MASVVSGGRRVAPVLRVEQVMSENVVTLRASETVADAVRVFMRERISGAPVLDDESGELAGVVSLTDVMWAEAGDGQGAGDNFSATNPLWGPESSPFYVLSAREAARESAVLATPLAALVAGQEPVTVGPDDLLSTAAALMLRKNVKRLPVVDPPGSLTLCGIVSRLDIMRCMASVLTNRDSGALGGALPEITVDEER